MFLRIHISINTGNEGNMNRRSFLKNLFAATATVGFLGAMSKIKMSDLGYASKSEDNGSSWLESDRHHDALQFVIDNITYNGEFQKLETHNFKFDNICFVFDMSSKPDYKVGDIIRIVT